jgi:murein L,D-transpeptidase YcbB/YkuD
MHGIWKTPLYIIGGRDRGANRRWMLGCLLSAVVAWASTGASWASEHRWYDGIFNRTSADYGQVVQEGGRSSSVEDRGDLRVDTAPLLSNEMLERLDVAIERYRKIMKKGGWSISTKLRFMRLGDDYEAVSAIRRQLVVYGDMPAKAANYYAGSKHFDERLEHGVKQFQKRHGLRVTGRLDRSTRNQLIVSPKTRLRQLKLSRQRIAELLGGREEKQYILVNIPGFQLEAVERGEVVRRHRVVVGRPDRQTPTLNVKIRAVNFFPYWHVPKSIAKRDLIPRLKRDPKYLSREHIRAARGSYDGPELGTKDIDWRKVNADNIRFRQDPGPWNALGLVRFDMPNKDIVYLHDTPLKSLFKRHRRAFSAGCVRVQNVMDLVAWITKNEQGTGKPGAIKKIVDSGDPVRLRNKRPKKFNIHLSRPVPVQFVYVTAWVQNDGNVHFRSDIYERDGVGSSARLADTKAPSSANALSP